MGYYINPPSETKEEFLEREGVEIDLIDVAITLDAVPVCLVDNGWFTAAGIAHDDRTLTEFTANPEDHRPRRYFAVPRNVLKPYCPLL